MLQKIFLVLQIEFICMFQAQQVLFLHIRYLITWQCIDMLLFFSLLVPFGFNEFSFQTKKIIISLDLCLVKYTYLNSLIFKFQQIDILEFILSTWHDSLEFKSKLWIFFMLFIFSPTLSLYSITIFLNSLSTDLKKIKFSAIISPFVEYYFWNVFPLTKVEKLKHIFLMNFLVFWLCKNCKKKVESLELCKSKNLFINHVLPIIKLWHGNFFFQKKKGSTWFGRLEVPWHAKTCQTLSTLFFL